LDRDRLPGGTRTLHDWITAHLERPARGGDIVRAQGLRVLVRKLRRSRVLEAQVSRDEAAGHSLPPERAAERSSLPAEAESRR
jgi:hypothetical protein